MVSVAPTARTVSPKPPQSAPRPKSETEPAGQASSPHRAARRWLTVTQRRCPHPVALPAPAIGALALQGPGPHALTARTQHGPKQDNHAGF